MKTITLSRILGALDLGSIDLDVEEAELVVLESAIEELNQKVKRVHIGTHTPEISRGCGRCSGSMGGTREMITESAELS